MECRRCKVTSDHVDEKTGLCSDCAFEADFGAEIGGLQEIVTDVDALLAAIKAAEGPDEIGAILARYAPPAGSELETATLREKLLRALQGKVSSPAKMADAWLRLAEKSDDGALAARAADALVSLVIEHAELWHTRDGEGYATVQAGGHKENHRIRSRKFRHWMTGQYFNEVSAKEDKEDANPDSLAAIFLGTRDKLPRVPPAQAIADARHALEAIAVHEGQEFEPKVRVAGVGNLIYIDLANDAWEAIEVSADGWQVVPQAPVRFIRPEGMLPLPTPAEGGSLSQLREFLNVTDEDWPLVVGFVVGGARPDGPYPVLNLDGEHGAAKSSAAKIIRCVVDPGKPSHRSKPRNEHDLVIHASRAWILSFDNLSSMPDWLSDALCRLSTGGGFGTRMLYSDDEERLFDSERPIILNGIEALASRGDLLDRSLLVTLPQMEDEERMLESDLDEAFERAWPEILGGLLDAISTALRRLPEIHLEGLPRMADFAAWVVAAEPALGLAPGEFMATYTANRKDANAVVIESNLVGSELMAFMATREDWEGTAKDLLGELTFSVSDEVKHSKRWPATPRGLSGVLRRLAPNLRSEGIEIEFAREGKARTRSIRITRSANDRPNRPPSSANPSDLQERAAGAAGADGWMPTLESLAESEVSREEDEE